MAKKAKEKSVKTSGKRLKRTILGTLSGVCMASALIVAAIPVKESTAADPSAPFASWTDAYDAKPDDVIPDYSGSDTKFYFDKDGLFGIAKVVRGTETPGVVVFYDNDSTQASANLEIPENVICFKYTMDDGKYKLQAVNAAEEMLYYVSKEAEYEEDVSGNSVLVSAAEYSPCFGTEYDNWIEKATYTFDGTGYTASEALKINVRYIGSKGYKVGADNKLVPSLDSSGQPTGVFEGATKFNTARIPSHILAVGNNAFKECTNLSSLTFTNQIQVIGNHAFEDCRRLTTLNFDNTSAELKSIGAYAFANCVYLKTVDIPNSVRQIGSGCFMNCEALSAANLYGSNQDGNADLENIGDGIFYNCTALQQLYLPNNLKPDNVSKMTHLVYGCKSLERLGLPKSGGDFTYTNVTGCENLVRVTVPNRNMKFECTFGPTTSSKNGYKHANPNDKTLDPLIIKNVDHCTFCADNLGSFSTFNDYEVNNKFTIITYRNDAAYTYACEHEYAVEYLDDNYKGQYERVKNNYFFTVDENDVLTKFGLYKETGEATIVDIPEAVGEHSVKTIASNTFSTFTKNGQIKYVYIPTTVRTIEPNAFNGCTNLQAVEFGEALNVQNIGNGAFKTMTTEDKPLRFIGTISAESVPFKYAMTPGNNYNSPDATTKYISYTSDFPNNLQIKLEVVKDPNTDEIISAIPTLVSAPSYEQFENSLGSAHYSLLHDIYDGISDNSIVNRANEEDKLVNSAYKKSKQSGAELTEREQAVLNAVTRATVPAGIVGMNADVYQDRDYLVSAILNTITEVPDNAFAGCTGLQTFIMRSSGADGGETLGSHVFDGDVKLSNVSLPETLTKMGDIPFYGCSSLNDVAFNDNPIYSCENAIIYETNPDGTRTIVECLKPRGKEVGTGKVRAEEFTNVTKVKPSAFRGCDGISQVYFGDAAIKEIPELCFADCDRLNYCDVSDSTESIGEYAFLNTALSDIKIPPSVMMIAETAFTKGGIGAGNYEPIKGLNIQCAVPSTAYTFATTHGFGTEDRILPTFYVQFYDFDGNKLGDLQKVTSGEDAVPPEPPVIAGMKFVGWKPDYKDVSGDLEIFPQYLPADEVPDNRPEYTVRFFNYEGTIVIRTQKVKEGSAATPPVTVPEVEGYTFLNYWLPEFDNIISDLDVYPQYKKNTAITDKPDDPSDKPDDPSDKPDDPTDKPDDPSDKPTDNPSDSKDPDNSQNNNSDSTNPENTNNANNAANNNPTDANKPGTSASTVNRPASAGSLSNGSTVNKKPSGTSVVVTKPGITNSDLVSATVNGSTDDFVVKISDSDSAKAAVEQALLNAYGSLDDIRYFAMDISLYDKTGTSKIQNLDGVSVTITMPIPDALTSYGGNNKVGSVINGDTLEKMDAKFTTINGVPCISFVARHFSPYTIYVDLNNLTATINGSDMTPKTGDPIHPKWFLSIGLALVSILLFFLKGSSKKVVKVIA